MFLKRKNRSWKNEAGFTLIETAVTVAIAGVLTGITVAGYLSWKPGYVLRDAVSNVRGGLERAKMRAVETRKECKVEFTTDGYEIYDGEYVMNNKDDNWGYVDSNGEFTDSTSYSSVSLDDYPNISVTDEDGGTTIPDFIFSPHGFLNSNDSTSIDVVHSTAGKAGISVYIAGYIGIEW